MLGRIVRILRPRGEDEVGESDGEYRLAEEESIDAPLHLFFGLSPILRNRHPCANDFSACLVCFHVAVPGHSCSAARLRASARTASNPSVFYNAAVKRRERVSHEPPPASRVS